MAVHRPHRPHHPHLPDLPLSAPTLLVWAKSSRVDDTWLPLWRHLHDASEVAALLWDHWLPASVRDHVAAALPGGAEDARILVRWLAGIHDIGKATPAFAVQVGPLADRMHDAGLRWDSALVAADRRFAPHATAGMVVADRWLIDEHGWTTTSTRPFTIVVGGHHGVVPDDSGLIAVRDDRPYLLGWPQAPREPQAPQAPQEPQEPHPPHDPTPWWRTQSELLHWMSTLTGALLRLPAWRDTRLPQTVQVLLTGIVIVADWIASNEDLFPYEQYDEHTAPTHPDGPDDRAARAWHRLDLPTPWSATASSLTAPDLVGERFALPEGATAHPLQHAAIAEARDMPGPELMIIEAPMGDGKTEAALAAVEVLAARFRLGGCYFALPTRATSDAMLRRFTSWTGRIPDADPGRGPYDIGLAHGKSRWNETYRDLLAGRVSNVGDADTPQEISAHYWLAGRKKVLLSSFVVGTIDQLLMASLQVKHVVLRHLGLAGKVVVIDEAHAYDVYMSRYLDGALAWLASYGVPVIVLSATLPARRRMEMLAAYESGKPSTPPGRGRGRGRGRGHSRRDTAPPPVVDSLPYPLIMTSRTGSAPVVRTPKASGRRTSIDVEYLTDDDTVLAARLATDLADGGCVLIIRNTVRRVQRTAEALRTALPDVPVTVAHSRFLDDHRAAKDTWLRETFGPPGDVVDRPHRAIVVASQVAEQSLDVDFDLLITDLAPIDLMLQRMGRLHRHPRPRPPRLGTARCLVTGADWSASPPRPDAGSVRVYQEFPLLSAAAVLADHGVGDGTPIVLPDDIAPLVQAAYGTGEAGPVEWRPALAAAETTFEAVLADKRGRAEVFRLARPGLVGTPITSWFKPVIDDLEARDRSTAAAQVRDGAESLQVLLLVRRDGQLYIPDGLPGGGSHVSTDASPDEKIAKNAARCTIALPQWIPEGAIIDELERRHNYPAWRERGTDAYRWLSGELVLDMDDGGNATVAGLVMTYDGDEGLRVEWGRS